MLSKDLALQEARAKTLNNFFFALVFVARLFFRKCVRLQSTNSVELQTLEIGLFSLVCTSALKGCISLRIGCSVTDKNYCETHKLRQLSCNTNKRRTLFLIQLRHQFQYNSNKFRYHLVWCVSTASSWQLGHYGWHYVCLST